MEWLHKLTVQDAYRCQVSASLVIEPHVSFEEVIQRLASTRDTAGLFVVSSTGELEGVITRTDLLDWARVKIGAALRAPLFSSERTLRLANLIRAETAGQVIHPDSKNSAVKLSDTLEHALRRMVETDQVVLPVIDAAGKLVGDLLLSELLVALLEKEKDIPQAHIFPSPKNEKG